MADSTAPRRPLLDVGGLCIDLQTRSGEARVVDNVSFHVGRGETLGIVGESGCGKSLSMLSLLRLTPPVARIGGGRAFFEGEDLLTLSPRALRRVRGGRVGFVFQDPLTSLNPVMRIGDQLAEVLVEHRDLTKAAALAEAERVLNSVGIPDARRRIDDYPHQFSGGMRQRVMIAMSIACRPSLLIADEPTTALDVTIQRQVVDLIAGLRQELGMAVIWISHDLALVAEVADRIAVFYAGTIVEEGPVGVVYESPSHPYTKGLVASIPGLAPSASRGRLHSIEGAPPELGKRPPGCPFAPRCAERVARCAEEVPVLSGRAGGHRVACFVAAPLETAA